MLPPRFSSHLVAGLIVLTVLGVVAGSYSPATGFTSLIGFSADRHDTELPALRQIPHAHAERQGYDGEFYAQLALDPLLRNPDLGQAIDNPAYRAHRMLFSWTAYVIGLGHPVWILEAYALQNVVAWIWFAWLLRRWIPLDSWTGLALWTGTVATYGALASLRLALTDGPATLIVALSVLALESGKPSSASALLGLAALGRETSFVAAAAIVASARNFRALAIAALKLGLSLVPLAAWLAYVFVLFGTNVFDGAGNIGLPLRGLAWKLGDLAALILRDGIDRSTAGSLSALAGFVAQGAVIVRAITRDGNRTPWAITGGAFLALTLLTREAVWGGTPGAYARVALPMTLAANILLAQRPGVSWWWIGVVNVSVIPGLLVLFGLI